MSDIYLPPDFYDAPQLKGLGDAARWHHLALISSVGKSGHHVRDSEGRLCTTAATAVHCSNTADPDAALAELEKACLVTVVEGDELPIRVDTLGAVIVT